MKKYVLGFLVLISSIMLIDIIQVDADLPPKTKLDLYMENELIFVGFVEFETENIETGNTLYEIKVEQFIKNSQNDERITVVGEGMRNDEIKSSIQKFFNVGDRVLIFANKINEEYQISPYSVNAKIFDPNLEFILPPLTLFKVGISIDEITCKSNFVLVLKISNDEPACIKEKHLEQLVSRNWTSGKHEVIS